MPSETIEWFYARAIEITARERRCDVCGGRLLGVFYLEPRHGRALVEKCLVCSRHAYLYVSPNKD